MRTMVSRKSKTPVNRSILLTLQAAEPKLFKAIIKGASPNVIKIICEIIYNILRGNVELKPEIRRKLKQYKKELRCMVCRKHSLTSKRRVLNQKGGGVFLPLIIGSVLSGLAGSLADKILDK